MVCYPEVQKKAQAELDKVLNGRLPEHSDIISLPYFSALIKEVYR
jgi:Cytochrome P450